jgi:hypothetical protein
VGTEIGMQTPERVPSIPKLLTPSEDALNPEVTVSQRALMLKLSLRPGGLPYLLLGPMW